MYDKYRFSNAKSDLVDAMLTLPDYRLSWRESLEAAFLEALLGNLASFGKITQRHVQDAIDEVWDWLEGFNDDDKDDILSDLQDLGEYYMGDLSPKQRSEFSRLYNLCIAYSSDDCDDDNSSQDILDQIYALL